MVATNDKYAQEIHDIFFRDIKRGVVLTFCISRSFFPYHSYYFHYKKTLNNSKWFTVR